MRAGWEITPKVQLIAVAATVLARLGFSGMGYAVGGHFQNTNINKQPNANPKNIPD